MVLNQVFRTLLHSRLKLGIQRYLADDRFQGDIVLLEPREREAEFFAMNPLAFWKRADAVQHGFESVRMTIEQNFDQLESVLAPLRPPARPRGGAPARRSRAGRPGLGRRRRSARDARPRARAAPGGQRPGVGFLSPHGSGLPPGW